MKRVLILVGSSATVIVALLVGLVLATRSQAPDKGAVSCPTYFAGPLGNALPTDHVASRWQVYQYDGEKGTAEVKVSVSTTATPSRPYSCELVITRAPETPGKGSDWRIGHVVKPDGFRGKTILYRVAIKASSDIRLDTGGVYVYDGLKSSGVATPQLTSEWRTFEGTMRVDPTATTFEIWFRLPIGEGTIRPGSGTVYFVPEVEVQAG